MWVQQLVTGSTVDTRARRPIAHTRRPRVDCAVVRLLALLSLDTTRTLAGESLCPRWELEHQQPAGGRCQTDEPATSHKM